MKKGLKVMGLLLLLAFICSGCDAMYASTTRDIRHSGFALSGAELKCDALLDDVDYDKVRFLTGKHAIMESGSVYELSIGQKYSNEQNCMASPLTSSVVALFDENVVKTAEGKYYFIVRTGENAAYSAVPSTDSNYMIYDAILKDSEVLKVKTVDASTGHYYVLKKDGNVYNYVVAKSISSATVVSSPVVYSRSNYDGEIIDFSYAGKTTGTSVRTNTKIYRMMATNREECSKYIDVACTYEMRLDEGLTEHQNRILGFSGSYLITTYGKQFNVTG
ncbi:MAG: hypothetical protein J6C28_01375 [Bacilli bacterium]|nr:hypothetical protein [Bacilli bacterium]